jgi:hypothetical protein
MYNSQRKYMPKDEQCVCDDFILVRFRSIENMATNETTNYTANNHEHSNDSSISTGLFGFVLVDTSIIKKNNIIYTC